MDRKAFALCAAATASLGALLSVGCGNGGAETATNARPQTRPRSAPPAVVVSPEKEFFEPDRYPAAERNSPATEIASEQGPVENRPQPVDPWAADTPAGESTVIEINVGEPGPADDTTQDFGTTGEKQSTAIDVAATEARSEALTPVPAELTSDSELKFSVAGASEPVEDVAVETIKIAVRAPGEQPLSDEPSVKPGTPAKAQAASRYATSDAKRELRPVLVTPRTTPTAAEPVVVTTVPTVAKAAPELIEAEPAITKSEPVNVAQAEPTPATAPELESTLVVKVEPEAVDANASRAKSEPAEIAKSETKSAAPIQESVVTPAEVTPAEVAPATSNLARTEIAAAPEPVEVVPLATIPPAPAAPAPIAVAPPMVAAAPAAISPSVPLPQVPGTRSPMMVATLARADERVRHAIQLAEKGAMYASRKEFTAAIELIAQAHDVERGTRQHSQAVSAGLLALKEAHDFVAPSRSEIDVVRLVAGHRTPVLKQANVTDLPPTLAAQYYYGYAKEHLAAGVGRETVGSIALYGLAKILVAGAGHNAQQLEFTGPAMALYQAALICEPQNFRAAHELGVLLAGSGQLEMAREMLMGSVAQAPQPVMFKNLAVVHSRLGEPQLAREAQQKADTLQQTMPETKAPSVQWVDPATFASLSAGTEANVPRTSAAASRGAAPAVDASTKPAPSVARKRPNTWNPLNLRR